MVALEHKTVREFLHSYWPAERGVGLTKIRLEPSWYNLFSPVIPIDPTKPPGASSVVNTNQTALERILNVSHNDDRPYIPEIQHVVSSAIADGLSRCGVIPNRQITQNLGPLNWNKRRAETEQLARAMVRRGEPDLTHDMPERLRQGNTTRIVMRAKFTGFAMVADAWFDYFCMVVLHTHATIALGHTIFVCLRRETGDAWDTILEFVALKSAAPPEPVLSNTCAGVTSFRMIGAVAWVETVDQGDDGGDQLQLRFKSETNKERTGKVEAGAKYNGHPLGGTAGQI